MKGNAEALTESANGIVTFVQYRHFLGNFGPTA